MMRLLSCLGFTGADAIFPEFLDMIVREYKVPRGKLHIAGQEINLSPRLFDQLERCPSS